MSLKKIVVRNFAWSGAAEVISNALSYVLIVLVARFLGPEELGIYSFCFAFVGIFTFAYDFGISYFYMTQVSSDRRNAKKYMGQYASLKLIFCILTLILPIIAIFFVENDSRITLLVFLAAVSLFFQNYSYVARNTYYALQKMKYEAIVRVVERIIAFGAGGFLLLSGHGLLAFLVVLAFSNAVSLVLSLYYLRKLDVTLSFKIDVPTWKVMLKTSWTSWLSNMFLIVYFQADTVMISFMSGYEASGIYNAAYKLINVISKVPWIVILVLFPIMAKAHAKMSKGALQVILEKGLSIMAILGFPIVVGTLVVADRVILLMYGEQFAPAGLVLRILVWTTLFLFLSNMVGWFFNSMRKPQVFAWVIGISLALNVLLNFILIPPFGYLGSAVATVISAVVNFILLYYLVRKEGYAFSLIRICAKPLLASLLMGAAVFFLQGSLNIFGVMVIAAALYFCLLFLFGEIKRDDLRNIL